tara:strand:+ start:640 stop:1137 length:498 start_codon:yes stop_codon:yes gene_type:complete
MFKVIDNFLDINEFNAIKKIVSGDNFPWYYNNSITNEKDLKNKFYFTHHFYKDLDPQHTPGVSSDYFYLLKNFLIKIECKSIIRIKANLHLNINKKQINQPHSDYSFSHKGCLFYLNDNNGLTYFKNKSVKPKANRVVFFDPSKKHSSSLCTDKNKRININFNYF